MKSLKKKIKKLLPNRFVQLYTDYKKRVSNKRLEGDEVKCVICKSTFKIFKDYGLVTRYNAQCHNCGSLERHRLLWHYLYNQTNLFSTNDSIRLLHFAPESIFFEKLKNLTNIDYVPCDLYPELYNFDDNIKIEKADITNIPFEDNSFDVVICNHVLEHIIEDKLAMSELYRVMKPKGFGVFMVPMTNQDISYEDYSITDPKEREKVYGQHDHVRLYGRDYFTRLKSVGFDVDDYANNYIDNFTDEEQFRFGFLKNEMVTICRK